MSFPRSAISARCANMSVRGSGHTTLVLTLRLRVHLWATPQSYNAQRVLDLMAAALQAASGETCQYRGATYTVRWEVVDGSAQDFEEFHAVALVRTSDDVITQDSAADARARGETPIPGDRTTAFHIGGVSRRGVIHVIFINNDQLESALAGNATARLLIGNDTAHESGHAIGLRHGRDGTLMAAVRSARLLHPLRFDDVDLVQVIDAAFFPEAQTPLGAGPVVPAGW